MGKYIKSFSNHNDYEDFTHSDDYIRPNTSYCKSENEVHYNPIPDPRLYVTFYAGTGYTTGLYAYYEYDSQYPDRPAIIGVDLLDKLWVDGVEADISTIDANYGGYDFSTEGEHTVAYLFKDPTTVPNAFFSDSVLAGGSIIIPASVTTIGEYALASCDGPEVIKISNNLTSIDDKAFCSDGVSFKDEQMRQYVLSINPNAIGSCRCMN